MNPTTLLTCVVVTNAGIGPRCVSLNEKHTLLISGTVSSDQNETKLATITPDHPYYLHATDATEGIYNGDWYNHGAGTNTSVEFEDDRHLVWTSGEAANVIDDSYTFDTAVKNIARDISAAFQFGLLLAEDVEDNDQVKWLRFKNTAVGTTRALTIASSDDIDHSFQLYQVPSSNWMLINRESDFADDHIPLFDRLQPRGYEDNETAYSKYAQTVYESGGNRIYGGTYSDFVQAAAPGITTTWPSSLVSYRDLYYAKLQITIPCLNPTSMSTASCTTSIEDLLIFLQHWGTIYGDFNSDGTTDVEDLLILIRQFGV